MNRIVVVDYGMGNLGSVANAFRRLGESCAISSDVDTIRRADGLVLPGVGAFGAAMNNLRERKLDEILTEQVIKKRTPFLGICLGLQLIAENSTELGFSRGLGWIDARVERIEPGDHLPVPQVGWNEAKFQNSSQLFRNISAGAHFYFDHSYHFMCDSELVEATCDYGGSWVAAIRSDNIYAVQFHPEKSQRNGLRILRNFLTFATAVS